jgi:hypothetical protein
VKNIDFMIKDRRHSCNPTVHGYQVTEFRRTQLAGVQVALNFGRKDV